MFEKYNTIFLKQDAFNVLFLGSSRAETHFDPKIFDSITGLKSYNAGITGATPRIAFAVLRAYLLNHPPPKYLVFDVDLHFLKYDVDTIRSFPRFFPYLSNPVLLEQFNKIDGRFVSFKYNPIHSLPYSGIGLLSASLHGWLDIEGKYDTVYYKGFQRTTFYDTILPLSTEPVTSWFNVTERTYLDSIILLSKNNKTDVLLVSSPMFLGGDKGIKNKKKIVSQLYNIAALNHLTFKDITSPPFAKRRDCFADMYHLSDKGSVLFTNDFSLFFKQYFTDKSVN